MSVTVSIVGAKELDKAFAGLPNEVSEKVLYQAHIDAAFPLVAAAHFLAPVGETGNLADSIGIERVGVKRGGEIGQIQVGPRRGGAYRGFHGHLIEFGKTNRDGTKTAPRPFMEPAFERTKGQVESGISNFLSKRITAFLKRTVRG